MVPLSSIVHGNDNSFFVYLFVLVSSVRCESLPSCVFIFSFFCHSPRFTVIGWVFSPTLFYFPYFFFVEFEIHAFHTPLTLFIRIYLPNIEWDVVDMGNEQCVRNEQAKESTGEKRRCKYTHTHTYSKR